jgi:hypothetical protein
MIIDIFFEPSCRSTANENPFIGFDCWVEVCNSKDPASDDFEDFRKGISGGK